MDECKPLGGGHSGDGRDALQPPGQSDEEFAGGGGLQQRQADGHGLSGDDEGVTGGGSGQGGRDMWRGDQLGIDRWPGGQLGSDRWLGGQLGGDRWPGGQWGIGRWRGGQWRHNIWQGGQLGRHVAGERRGMRETVVVV